MTLSSALVVTESSQIVVQSLLKHLDKMFCQAYHFGGEERFEQSSTGILNHAWNWTQGCEDTVTILAEGFGDKASEMGYQNTGSNRGRNEQVRLRVGAKIEESWKILKWFEHGKRMAEKRLVKRAYGSEMGPTGVEASFLLYG